MALPEFTLRQLLEAGVHFGHQTQRWNPRMEEFIYGERNGIHIMDLTQTVPMLDAALNIVRETVAKGGRILFVGTKRQASTAIAEAAAIFIPSVMSVAEASKAPRKIPGKASTLLIWFG